MLNHRAVFGAAALAAAIAIGSPVPQAAAGQQSLIDLIGKLKLEEQSAANDPGNVSDGFPGDIERYGWFASDSEDGYFMKKKELKKALKKAGVKLKNGFSIDVTENGSVEAAGKKNKHFQFTAGGTTGHDARILFDVYDKNDELLAEGLRIQLDEGVVTGASKAKGFQLNEGNTTYTFNQLISQFGIADTPAPVSNSVNPIQIGGIEARKGDLDFVIDYDNQTVTFIGAEAKKKYKFDVWFNDTFGEENKTYWEVKVKTGKVVASPHSV